MRTEPIILFDGVCNLCNAMVRFVIKRDKRGDILFSALQGETAKKLLAAFNLPVQETATMVFIEKGKIYLRSKAALRICLHLKAGWPLCYGFIIVPAFLRNGIYNLIAKNRYKWFGVKQECMVPTVQLKARFLD